MNKLNFIKFQEELKKARRTKRPTLHYLETETQFKIFFKNYEYWEYYSVVEKSMIITHGERNDLTPDECMDDFRMEYLYHAVELEEETVKEIIENELIGKKLDDKNNPYANSPMEKAMISQIEESRAKLEEALNTLL